MSEKIRVDKTPFIRIRQRYEAGEDVPRYAVKAAEEVLGEKFIRCGLAQRPDVADRVAGDDTFGDVDGVVVL